MAPPGKALVLVLPGLPLPADADAVFAPLPEVASRPGIEDASRPPDGLARLLDRTLCGLFQ